MKLLLDTHIFLWHITDAPQLPAGVRGLIRDPENAIFLSPVSI
jgi:PIN domain nuclease of toxin-antitoxin system